VYHANGLPFQLLIANLGSRERGEAKQGCLVFLVGTENIGGAPRGLYTELPEAVAVYRSVAESLMDPPNKPLDKKELEGAAERLRKQTEEVKQEELLPKQPPDFEQQANI
jgi:hypothetical protein